MESEDSSELIGVVPLAGGDEKQIFLAPNEVLYVIGANGSGKSTLLYRWVQHKTSAVLLAGNREVVFGSSAVSISAQQAANEEGWRRGQINQAKSRVEKSHHNNTARLDVLLFRLKSLSDDVNKRYRQVHLAGGNSQELEEINKGEPIGLLNLALKRAAIHVTLDWTDRSELQVEKEGCDAPYGAHEMSDGERAAVILAGEVILADIGALILVDEPERHLHRSISSPLLQYLRAIRPDLRWVIATHDLSLPRDDIGSDVLVLYGYTADKRWKGEFLENPGSLPIPLTEAIYGARQRVLFVEGNEESRDAPLYQHIFKGVTVVPVGTCRDVFESVRGLKRVPNLHQMCGRGLVDGDNRDDVQSLRKNGVSVLHVYAIESVYYHPDIIKCMLELSAELVCLKDVIDSALSAIGDSSHLAKMTAYRSYRERYMREMLDVDSFASAARELVRIDGPAAIAASRKEIDELKERGDWRGVVERCKIKATGAPKAISLRMGYRGVDQYERAVIKTLGREGQLDAVVRSLVPDPFADMA